MPEAIPSIAHPPAPPPTSGNAGIALADTVRRLKQIAAEAGDHLYLSDGPPHPDFELLGACGELLHLMKRRKELMEAQHAAFSANFFQLPEVEKERRRAEAESIFKEAKSLDGPISSLLSRARKLSAKTAAGVYAKVLVIRSSETGAGRLAQTLADDLISVPTLRASIWRDERAQP